MISSAIKYIEKYCCEDLSQIENYEVAISDKDNVWVLHHRRETHDKDGKVLKAAIPMKELKLQGLYFGRPASELIFMRESDHQKLHTSLQKFEGGWKRTKEANEKVSAARKGKHYYNNGKITVLRFTCPDGFVEGRLGNFRAWNKGVHKNG